MSQNTICTTQSPGLDPDWARSFPFPPFFPMFSALRLLCSPQRRWWEAGRRSASTCGSLVPIVPSRAAKAKPNKSQISALVKSVTLPSLSLSPSLAPPTQSPQSRRSAGLVRSDPRSPQVGIRQLNCTRSRASRGFNPHQKASICSVSDAFVI